MTMYVDAHVALDEHEWVSEFVIDARQHEITTMQFTGIVTAITQMTTALVSSCTEQP